MRTRYGKSVSLAWGIRLMLTAEWAQAQSRFGDGESLVGRDLIFD